MKFKNTSLAITLLAASFASHAIASDYWIKAEGEVTGPYTVNTTVETNIPGDIELAVDLSLRGQQPDDVAIGTNFRSIPYSGQPVTFVLDGEEKTTPSDSKLPTGEYDVNVSFHPGWIENSAVAEPLNIDDSIETSFVVSLSGSGVSSSDAQQRAEGQSWVYMNVGFNQPWNMSDMISRFGDPVYIEHSTLNPNIMKNYYFESIDMTFVVNEDRQKVIKWSEGRNPE